MVGTALLKNNLSAKSAHYITEITTLTSIHLKNYTEKLVLQTRYMRNTMPHIRKFGFLFRLHMNFQ